jgi:hypothetical protein
MVKVVICAPYFEEATFLWSPFLKNWLANELKKRGVEPVVLWGNDCIPEKFAEAVKDPDVYAVDGVGHGNERTFTGQGYSELLKVGMLLGEEWKHIFFGPVSCLVGQQLVPYMVQQGVPAAVGEETEYFFTAAGTPGDGSDPALDPLEKYYHYAEYGGRLLYMAEGHTAGEAYQNMLQEYERQAQEAEKVDAETAYWLRYDAQHRKFFGDPNFRFPITGVRTTVQVQALGTRIASEKTDVISVSGKVVAEDGSVPKGAVRVRVDDQVADATLDANGAFETSFTFVWDQNIDITYTVTVEYQGYSNAVRYLPSRATTTVTVHSTRSPSKTKITKVTATRENDTVHLTIEGTVTDDKGMPVANGDVDILITDTYPKRDTVKTDANGKFTYKCDVPVGWLETQLTVTATFKGNDVLQPSIDEVQAKFPPNWKIILIVAGAAIVIIALIILAAILTG